MAGSHGPFVQAIGAVAVTHFLAIDNGERMRDQLQFCGSRRWASGKWARVEGVSGAVQILADLVLGVVIAASPGPRAGRAMTSEDVSTNRRRRPFLAQSRTAAAYRSVWRVVRVSCGPAPAWDHSARSTMAVETRAAWRPGEVGDGVGQHEGADGHQDHPQGGHGRLGAAASSSANTVHNHRPATIPSGMPTTVRSRRRPRPARPRWPPAGGG